MAVVWREVSFSVPWGVISGKEFGPSNGKPFLGLHGWLDNANTFDKLAAFLPKDIHFVSIDFPGHGRSSHKPTGSTYNLIDRVMDVRRVLRQLQWKEFSAIGHSMGATVAGLYAGTFPTEVRHLVLIEIAIPFYERPGHPADVLARYISMSTSEEDIKPTLYPDIEGIAEKIVKASAMNKDAARILAERGCVSPKDGTGFQFSHDKRIRNGQSYLLSLEAAQAFFSRITCNVLLVSAQHPIVNDAVEARLKVLQESANVFTAKRIPGGHHVHIDSPEMVGREIDNFICCNNSFPSCQISKL